MKGRKCTTYVHPAADPLVVWAAMYSQGQRISTTRLADMSGVANQTLQSWFGGTRGPTIANLRAVINALGYEITIRRKV